MKRTLLVMAITSLIATPLGGVSVCRADDPAAPAGPRVPYDPELYVLSYDVFLANGNPGDAFLVAERAVSFRPRDYAWRRRAAQSAEWSGRVAQALEQWFFLARETHQQDAIDRAFALARALGDGKRLKLLLEERGVDSSPALLREYVSACETAGAPEDAITALERQLGGADRRYALVQLARLYEVVGRQVDAIAIRLELAARSGVSGPELLKAASLAYGSGDIQAAYTILSLGRQLPATEQEFWKTYGDLAWALQDMRMAEKASRLLLESGAAREVDFQRLIMISREKRGDQAYTLALEAWRRFGKSEFFINLLELGIARKRYVELAELIGAAEGAGSLKNLEGSAFFWTLVAQVYRATGNPGASMRSYRRALALTPADGEVAAGYVWWLLDLDQRTELRRTLQAWQGRERAMPELTEAFGAAYAALGENSRALTYFQSLYGSRRSDPSWLAAYADILEQAGWPEAAFVERLRALQLSHKRMNGKIGSDSDDRRALLHDYARLAMLLTPGDAPDSLVQGIMHSPQDETSRQLVAAWALSSQRSDLARIWFWREFSRMTKRPAWVELSLALEENDRPRIGRLLEHELNRLAYRDAIEGAQRAGYAPLAESLAFERFQANDRDHLLDRQIRELYGAHPGWFSYRINLIDQGGVGFLDQQVALAAPMTSRYSLRLNAGNADIRAQKGGVLGRYPGSIQSAQAGVAIRHEQGKTELMAGMRDGLSRHAVLSLLSDWKIGSRHNLNISLRLGAPATETVPLQIAGLKDEAGLAVLTALTPRDILMVRVSGRSLRDQERRQLGEGASFETELARRLLNSWPDTSVRMFGGYHYYARTGAPSGTTLALIPSGAAAGASFFVPPTFTQTGLGISIGQEGRNSYIRNWRPFGAADMIWNSSSSFGYRYELGLLGPFFGLDNFEFAFEQDSGAFGRSETTTRLDLRYRYYFK